MRTVCGVDVAAGVAAEGVGKGACAARRLALGPHIHGGAHHARVLAKHLARAQRAQRENAARQRI